MNVLLLCEGDAETRASWSGTAKSVLDELRHRGHQVHSRDIDLHGAAKWLAAARTFAPSRARWGVKYRLLPFPACLRTRNAGSAIDTHADTDVILQIGATFRPAGRGSIPYFVYCDSNIMMAQHARLTGQSPASQLTAAELEQVVARERDVYGSAAGVFAIHDQLRRSFIEDFGVAPSRAATVYAGPNFDSTQIPLRVGRPSTRPPTILFVGAQFERKGGDTLLAAFRRVRASVPTAELVIVGPGEPVSQEAGVTTLGYLDKDTPTGREALVRAYLSADVFCLPTLFEPFGVAFLEAMCFALPCVGSNVGAVPEMISEGETGFLVPPRDADALADRLCRLLLDPDLGQAMGSAGRARFERLFTWKAVVGRMMGLIEPVVADARKAG